MKVSNGKVRKPEIRECKSSARVGPPERRSQSAELLDYVMNTLGVPERGVIKAVSDAFRDLLRYYRLHQHTQTWPELAPQNELKKQRILAT